MAEEPQPMTLQQRIASLNAAHMSRTPGDSPVPRPKPQPPQMPPKRPDVIRHKTVNNPPEQVNGSVTSARIGNVPAGQERRANGVLPPPRPTTNGQIVSSPTKPKPAPPPLPRRESSQAPPPLPSRQSSQDTSRRGSTDSRASEVSSNDGGRLTATRTKSTDSSSRIRAPAWGEGELPPLPTRSTNVTQRKYSAEQPKYVNRAPSSDETSLALVIVEEKRRASRPSLPPPLPSRNGPIPVKTRESAGPVPSVQQAEHKTLLPAASQPIPTRPKRSPLDLGMNTPQVPTGMEALITNGLQRERDHSQQPPPIPLSSRPDLSAIQATKPRTSNSLNNGHSNSSPSTSNVCMICRDFSAPDHHATLFPRSTVSSLQTLAVQLTAPFSSHTDKARVIFTWLHHNIRYDVDAFFNHRIQPSTPNSTLSTGLAVCEGYAALFTNLATHAGLESVVIGGHGKGYGYTPLAPGSPLPPYEAGHAWNAVRIDHGEWKLIDACWGAGHVQGKGKPYQQVFAPEHFNMSNEEFGVKHFPANKDHFFLPHGRQMSWEEYIQINPASWPDGDGEPPTVFTNAKVDYGIGERTVKPRNRKVSVHHSSTTSIRFQFSLMCPHWTLDNHTRKGPPPVFLLAIGGIDGRNKDNIPLEHIPGRNGAGGDLWYVDVPARELGAPGQTVTLFAINSFGERQNARGLTVREYLDGKGRVGMGFVGVAAWDLVD